MFEVAAQRGVPLATILTVAAVAVGLYLLSAIAYRLRNVILLLIVAGFIAMALNPLVVMLQSWKIRRRGYAVAIVTAWSVLVFAGLAVIFGYPLINGVTNLAHHLPTYVSQVEHGRGWLGRLARKYHLERWVTKNQSKLANFGTDLGKPALAVGKGAFSLLTALAALFALVILMLLEAPKIRIGFIKMISPERAEHLTRVAGRVNRSVTGYVFGDFLTSLIAGIVVFVTLLILGVPFPFLWGLWVALVDFLPIVGGLLAGVPTVLFAMLHSVPAGIITLVVFLIYTQIENHMLNPIVMGRTVKINPLLVLTSVLVGAEIGSWIGGFPGGFVGALLAVPIAGSIQVVVQEVWLVTRPEEADDPPVIPQISET
jgi:predicted PurR-regulated permease PerM